MIINFSAIQTNCKLGQFEENYNKATTLIKSLPEFERHLVLLPELWTSGFTENLSEAYNTNLEIINSLRDLASSKNIIIAGSFIAQEVGDFYNQLILIHSNGKDIVKYNKNHLFPQMREEILFKKGSSLALVEIWDVKFGLAICYDLRFPELFRNYVAAGAEVCLIPAQWPLKRIAHYKALLIARAIENQMIILSTNTCGETGNTLFGGASTLINSSGEQLFSLKNFEQTTTEALNIEDTRQLRSNFPVLEDANLIFTKKINSHTFK